jgi:hypothetical protein
MVKVNQRTSTTYLVLVIDIYRIDKLVTASACTSVGTASIDFQIHLVPDVGNIEIKPLEGKKERKRVERERSVCLMFKLAAVALSIDANPFNHDPQKGSYKIFRSTNT